MFGTKLIYSIGYTFVINYLLVVKGKEYEKLLLNL